MNYFHVLKHKIKGVDSAFIVDFTKVCSISVRPSGNQIEPGCYLEFRFVGYHNVEILYVTGTLEAVLESIRKEMRKDEL